MSEVSAGLTQAPQLEAHLTMQEGVHLPHSQHVEDCGQLLEKREVLEGERRRERGKGKGREGGEGVSIGSCQTSPLLSSTPHSHQPACPSCCPGVACKWCTRVSVLGRRQAEQFPRATGQSPAEDEDSQKKRAKKNVLVKFSSVAFKSPC